MLPRNMKKTPYKLLIIGPQCFFQYCPKRPARLKNPYNLFNVSLTWYKSLFQAGVAMFKNPTVHYVSNEFVDMQRGLDCRHKEGGGRLAGGGCFSWSAWWAKFGKLQYGPHYKAELHSLCFVSNDFQDYLIYPKNLQCRYSLFITKHTCHS